MKPSKNETKNDFTKRCMESKADKDTPEDEKLNECYDAWSEAEAQKEESMQNLKEDFWRNYAKWEREQVAEFIDANESYLKDYGIDTSLDIDTLMDEESDYPYYIAVSEEGTFYVQIEGNTYPMEFPREGVSWENSQYYTERITISREESMKRITISEEATVNGVTYPVGTTFKLLREGYIKWEDRAKALYDHLISEGEASELEDLDWEEDDLIDVFKEGYNDTIVQYVEFTDSSKMFGNREYYVVTDDEADQLFYDSEKELIDDMGLDTFSASFQREILTSGDKYINSSWFDEAMAESYGIYVDDIRDEPAFNDEDYESRLEEEMADANVSDESDFIDYLKKDYDNGIDWYEQQGFGDLSDVVRDQNLLNIDAIVEAIRDRDGRAGALASYDGEEYEQGQFFIYRVN